MDKDKRKELQESYKQMKTWCGAIQITNLSNGKIYIDTYPNLKNKWLTLKMQLDSGRFATAELQQDWKNEGESSFKYEVLEQLDASELSDVKWEMKQLKKKWLSKLEPYGEKGYNKPIAE